jgi:FixJ family two-component response regulator
VEKTSASEAQARRDLIAVVDDDESVRNAVQGVLRSAGLKARTFGSAEEFLRSGQQAQIACVISDMQMPGMSGLELLAQLATAEHRIPVIFITAYGTPRVREQARRAGAVQFLDKPFDDELLLEIVRGEIAA